MLIHPDFDPVALHLGPVAVRWYGLMYLAGFLAGSWVARWRIRTQPWLNWTVEEADNFLTYVVLGVIFGGRLGYVLFYKPLYYFEHPLDILAVWQGGMSFHGGFLGVVLGGWLFARRHQRHWMAVTDFVAPLVPFGLGFGRIGNFINGELPGRVTDVPWAMIFPHIDALPRHPSQLYEALLEGVVLGALAAPHHPRPPPRAAGLPHRSAARRPDSPSLSPAGALRRPPGHLRRCRTGPRGSALGSRRLNRIRDRWSAEGRGIGELFVRVATKLLPRSLYADKAIHGLSSDRGGGIGERLTSTEPLRTK